MPGARRIQVRRQRRTQQRQELTESAVSCGPARPAVQIILKDDHGGNFIDLFAAFAPVETQFFQVLLGGEARQAFIPKYHGDVQYFMELLGKAGNLFTLRALMSAHVQWLSYNDFVNFV